MKDHIQDKHHITSLQRTVRTQSRRIREYERVNQDLRESLEQANYSWGKLNKELKELKKAKPKDKDYELIVKGWTDEVMEELKVYMTVMVNCGDNLELLLGGLNTLILKSDGIPIIYRHINHDLIYTTYKEAYEFLLNSTFIVPLEGGGIKSLTLTDEELEG